MIARIDEITLRERVAEGKTDAEIAEEVGTSPRTVRRALEALGIKRERPKRGEPRPPGYLLRLQSVQQRHDLHLAARAAGRETSEWLLALALEGPALASVARDPTESTLERRMALAELFELLLGPKDRDTDSAPEE